MAALRLALCAVLITVASSVVIGIDVGAAFMKVALVQLGVPLEVVPNTISKRKTDTAILFDRGERLFGPCLFVPRTEASAVASTTPATLPAPLQGRMRWG